MNEIKKVIQRIYEFDLKNCAVRDGDEMIPTESGNEFVNTFVKRDFDRGIIVTPGSYTRGFIYKSSNNGEFYNNPEWLPETENFSLNIYGLKKGSFYKVTVIGRNVRKYNRLSDVTDNRKLEVITNSQEMLINADLSENMVNSNFFGIFKATSIEEDLFFTIGKIYINNIIIEEVEILKDENTDEEKLNDFELDSGKSNIVAYGVFSPVFANEAGKYSELTKITGKGINIYFDKTDNSYIVERDNSEDTIKSSFTAANYIIDLNFNKAPKIRMYEITEVSADASPNTLKQGFIKFQILDKLGTPIKYSINSGRIAVIIKKLL